MTISLLGIALLGSALMGLGVIAAQNKPTRALVPVRVSRNKRL